MRHYLGIGMIASAAFSAAIALSPHPAHAVTSITITGEDNFGNTATNTAPSPVNFGPASVGTWTAQGTASGSPPFGEGTMFSNTIAAQTLGAGTFTLWITENGLTDPLGGVSFFSSLTTNQLFDGVDSVTLTTSFQADNSTPGPTVALGTILDTATFTTSNATQTGTLPVNITGTYSITQQYIVHANGAGGADLTIFQTTVPEPASMALLGMGLVGMAMFGRRSRR